jgi:hypothetical protein
MSNVLPPNPGKVSHFMLSSVSGGRILIDFLLLGYLCQSIDHGTLQYVASGVMNRLIILFNLITSTTSMKCKQHQLNWCMIYFLISLMFHGFLVQHGKFETNCPTRDILQLSLVLSCALKDLNALQVNILLYIR